MIDQIWKKNAQTHRNMKMVEGAAKIRFSSENFLKESQMVLLEVSRTLQKCPAWFSKKIAEFSPKGMKNFETEIFEGLNGSYLTIRNTYLCPSQFLDTFCFQFDFELKIIFVWKSGKL